MADTAEFDRQIRCLPSISTTTSGHHLCCTNNWHDISPRIQLQRQQQYSFQNRYATPHIATFCLQRSQLAATNAQMAHHHRACLYNPSLSMTTLLNPQSFSSSYPTAFASSANTFSSNSMAGYINQDFVPTIHQHVYEPLIGIRDSAHENVHGHRRRRSSTGQIFTDSNAPNIGAADDQELSDLMLYSSHKSALDLSSILPKEVEENEDCLYPPEWINTFDTPSPTVADALTSGSSPPCELQQLTETRFKSMLMHEQRGRMRSGVESELNILKDASIVDCEEYVPSNLLNNLTLDYSLSGNECRQVDFDKTVGGQLPTSEVSSAAVDPNETTREVSDAFDMLQKTWLPAFLPWRSRFPVEDPTRDPDFAESTLYSSFRSDIPGPIIQEVDF